MLLDQISCGFSKKKSNIMLRNCTHDFRIQVNLHGNGTMISGGLCQKKIINGNAKANYSRERERYTGTRPHINMRGTDKLMAASSNSSTHTYLPVT
jgi:hypothetical protein